MKKVLLLGDSIRMGYDSYVKEELKDEFEVYYDDTDNGRFSAYTIWQFNILNNKYGPFDIVHFNNGYWDMNHECPDGSETFPLEDYLHNLKRLIGLIRQINAIPIFSTTIPIYETKEDTLYNGVMYQKINYLDSWVTKYNAAAIHLMEEEHVLVNDLYSLLLDEPRYAKCQDSLHLTTEGYIKCAKKVASIIKEASLIKNDYIKKQVKITVKKITIYEDLIKQFENPILHACSLHVGDEFISINGLKPSGLCEEAWKIMQPYVESLSLGKGDFFDGWMKNKMSAMISCNDGFRPVSFYLEVI